MAINANTKQWMDWLEQNGANQYGALNEQQHKAIKVALNALPRYKDESPTDGKVFYVGAERDKDMKMRLVIYIFSPEIECGGWWRGLLTNEYCQGNDSNKTRYQKTMEVLNRVGITDIRQIASLIGKTIPIWVKGREWNGNMIYDIASIGGNNSQPADAVMLEELFKSLPNGSAQSQTPSKAPVVNDMPNGNTPPNPAFM